MSVLQEQKDAEFQKFSKILMRERRKRIILRIKNIINRGL